MPTKHTKPQPNLKIKAQGYYKHNETINGFHKELKAKLAANNIMTGHADILKEKPEDFINKYNAVNIFGISHLTVYTDGSYYTD